MNTSQVAVANKYSAEVWEYMLRYPANVRDDVLVYERTSNYKDEMAEDAHSNARSKLARAERDPQYALDWARQIVASGAHRNDWNWLTLSEKLAKASQQDYDDAYATYRRIMQEGRFDKVKEPPASLRPDENRAFLQVQKEWRESGGEAEGSGDGGAEGRQEVEGFSDLYGTVQQVRPAG